MAKVELKQPIVDEISALLADAQALVAVDYRGLTVEQDTELRKTLRKEGVVYKVYKNTLIKRAIAGTQWEAMGEVLEGPTAIAISTTDATAPARVLFEASKKMPKLELKAGIVAGTFYDDQMIKVIATIPSREVLLGRLLGSMQGSISGFARVINQIAEKKEETAA